MKKLILGALAALCAMLALPALASAAPVHLSPQPKGTATVHGGHSELTRSGGGGFTGTTTTGTAVFDNTTTGRLKLTFHGVRSTVGGFNCNSPGQPTGTVTTTELTFHLVTLGDGSPGVLVTGNATTGESGWGHHFVTFGCGVFIPTVDVRGNGVLGTITKPKCGEKSNTATFSFKKGAGPGLQQHTAYTGTNYTLESDLGTGYSLAAMETEATVTFAGGATPELVCT